MSSPGRTPLTPVEKAKRLAARTYRKLIETRQLTEDDLLSMRVGDKAMGRKPVPIQKQIKRAKKEFLSALDTYRDESQKSHVNVPDIRSVLRELKVYRADEKTGRKAADKVMQLKDFLRKEEAKLEAAKVEECALKSWSGKGRPPMSKEEKIEHFATKVTEIQTEINELIANAPLHKQLYYSLNDIRLEIRRKKALLKTDFSDDADNQVKSDLLALEAQRDALEEEFNEELKKAGINNIKDIDEEPVTKVAKTLPNSTNTMSNLANALPNSTNAVPNLANQLSNSENEYQNLVTLPLDDIERKLESGEYDKDHAESTLNNRLIAIKEEQADLEELARIITRRNQLRNEEQRIHTVLKKLGK